MNDKILTTLQNNNPINISMKETIFVNNIIPRLFNLFYELENILDFDIEILTYD